MKTYYWDASMAGAKKGKYVTEIMKEVDDDLVTVDRAEFDTDAEAEQFGMDWGNGKNIEMRHVEEIED